MEQPRRPNKRTGINDTLLYYERRKIKRRNCLQICCMICCTSIILLLFVAFLLIFVGVPMIFKNSPELQRKLVFPTDDLLPSNPEFSNFEKYNIRGARDLHVLVNSDKNITLGVWHLLPHALVGSLENFDYTGALAQTEFPVVIHFHSNDGNRIKFADMYNVLRTYFHVIAFDYRGCGDSSVITPTEEEIVEDSLELYKWVREQTDADIHFWGHALGAALATHTVAKLREDDIIPMGLFLEAPFTNMREQVKQISLIRKLFSWMPWYESTILDPLEKNGFFLNTAGYILKVDCPIMIIHAKDDKITSYTLGEKLYKIAEDRRDPKTQGNVTFHLLPELGYGHSSISNDPDLPDYIKNHINICEAYAKERS